MDKYLIVLDIDGTLLTSSKEISLLTKNYLKQLIKEGHKIILASGRPIRSMISYYNELELDTPMICYNGGLVINPKDPSYSSIAYTFPIKEVKDIIKGLGDNILNIMCETQNTIYVDKKDDYLDGFFWFKNMEIINGNLLEILDKAPLTFIAKFKSDANKDEITAIANQFSDLKARFWTGAPYFELYRSECSKGGSMLDIANLYNIDSNHIISFGDADNDIELFEHSTISVAMKNSKSRVKEEADIITEFDNDHDGIYYALKQLIKA